MSNDQRPQPSQSPQAQRLEPIRIREIRFHMENAHPVNLGPPFTTNGATHALRAYKQANGDELQLWYEPWLRRYRAVYLRNGKIWEEGTLRGEVCIPETWGCYREDR